MWSAGMKTVESKTDNVKEEWRIRSTCGVALTVNLVKKSEVKLKRSDAMALAPQADQYASQPRRLSRPLRG
ncbi:unnamed protein product [Caenorhabditis auriculariae]|uniref:Uncharacterized protein n=1 Tax=Caenorhabditis auriculariae TaxID=2777116 RepID=A0A8S1GPZ6_9PELO|nr:unnamed protein product [Caenorhabditis auriculariae]